MKHFILFLTFFAVSISIMAQSVRTISSHRKRGKITFCKNVDINFPEIYHISTHNGDTLPQLPDVIKLEVENICWWYNSPSFYGNVEKKVNGTWQNFPLVDCVIFDDLYRGWPQGGPFIIDISQNIFKNKFTSGDYRANLSIYERPRVNIRVTDSCVYQTDSIIRTDRPFVFKILPSNGDSIHLLFENHTGHYVQPQEMPSITDKSNIERHPLAGSGTGDETAWMKKNCLIKPGGAVIFSLPTTWNVQTLRADLQRNYPTGRLNGDYLVCLPMNVLMSGYFSLR